LKPRPLSRWNLREGKDIGKEPEIADRTVIELHVSNDPEAKDQYAAHIFIDDVDVVQIWCNRIGVFRGGVPPIYCLGYGTFEIACLAARLFRISPKIKDALPGIEVLGRYVEVMEE